MAYVRITETLIDSTRARIERMSRQAQSALDAPPGIETVKDEYAQLGLEHAYAPAPHLRGHLPDEWLGEMRCLEATFLNSDGGTVASARHDFDGEYKVPAPVSRYYFRLRVHLEDLSGDLRRWVEVKAEYDAEVYRIQRQHRDAEVQITAFLRTHTSLNKAIKAMPELEMYIPQEYMDKLNAPSPKRQKQAAEEQPAVEVDRGQLAALGVAHRLTSTGG